MKLSELFPQKRVLSFEVFPPKRTSPIGTVYHALSALQGLNPDFISVTYGASGGAGTSDTLNIASSIKKDYMVESVAHLPCISWSFWNSSAGTELKISWPFAVICPRTENRAVISPMPAISFPLLRNREIFTFWRPAIRKAIQNRKTS